MDLLFLVHLGSTLAMAGLIWFVQIVHYPLFAAVGPERFVAYETLHAQLTSVVVVPFMCAEAFTAATLLWLRPPGVSFALAAAGLALVVLIWLSTFVVQVPLHQTLASGFDADAHRRLVGSNWIRTVLWSLRAALVLWMAAGWRAAA
jgi:uncharacterized membrane protein